MAAVYNTSAKEGVDINQVFMLDTNTPELPRPPFNPGELAWGTDGSEWVYCTASLTIGAGSAVLISQVPDSWSVAPIGGATIAASVVGRLVGVVTGSNGSLFVPAPSGTQVGAYFWVQRAGNCRNIKCIASTAINAQLYSSAVTAGAVNSAAGGAGTTYQINGIVISQAVGSAAGPNTAVLNYPVGGIQA